MRNCNCSNTIRQDKDEIRKRAIKYSETFEVDVQIHSWTQRGFGRLWDYEEKGSVERGRGVVEVIEFRNDKSKDVLQDSKQPKSDKPNRKRKPKKSTKSVESDSGEILQGS